MAIVFVGDCLYDDCHQCLCSYGTRLAYIYGLKHPTSIFRTVMIGVTPPGHFGWEPEVIDEQLKYYAALWAQDAERRTQVPDLIATMLNVFENMPDSWMLIPIDPGKVKVATFISLYHRSGLELPKFLKLI